MPVQSSFVKITRLKDERCRLREIIGKLLLGYLRDPLNIRLPNMFMSASDLYSVVAPD
jgi:hypothetical protein